MLIALVNKKFRALLLLMLAAVLLFALPAFAEDPLTFTVSVEPASLTEPGPVKVSVRVANNSGADLTEPVILQDPDGQVVTAFGDGGQALIKAGDFVSAVLDYNVTQAQLSEGKLTYTLSYNQVDAGGSVVVQTLARSAELEYAGTHVELIANRVIDPEVVRYGKTVNVQYELYNAGNVEIKNIRVRENSSISGTAQTVASLAPGERTTIQFTATMTGTSMTSKGKITYTAGSESLSQELPEATILRATPGLELDNILSADKTSITDGETVTLTLTIKNNGNITYSNISVTDAEYGELFTNLTLGPGETLIKEKQFPLSKTTTFKYTVTLPDNTGTTNTVTSNEVKISVYDPTQVMMLNVMAAAEPAAIASAPADVRFTLTVTNNSSLEAKNIHLLHGGTQFYTISSLAPSEAVTVTRDFSVSQAGKFQFTASVKDALDNTVTFDSNELTIAYAAPTAAPTMAPMVTVAPLITVTTAPIEVLEPVTLQTNRLLHIAALVLGALFICSFALFVISTVIRTRRRSASKNAFDHMELAEKRDYHQPARDAEDVIEEAPAPQEEAPAAPMEKPSDEILKEEAPAENADNGAYRLTREDSLPAEPAQAAAKESAPQTRRRRRADRSAEAPNEDE